MSQPEQLKGQDGSNQGATDCDELCVLARRKVYKFRLPYASIQKAVRNSCEVCTVFDKAILTVVDGCLPELFRGPQDENERTTILDTLVVVSLVQTDIYHSFSTKRLMEIWQMEMEISGRRMRIDFFRDLDEQPEFILGDFTFPPKPDYGPTTCSDRAFERARGWLRDCLEHHGCKAIAREWAPSHSRPPKRLLDLRTDTIRLIHTDTCGSHFEAPYVCLSHRWGDTRHRRLTTTVHTIQEHSQGIPWGDLPRTFQDAVTICRRMSIDYLWIDSLCILQEFDGILEDEASLRETRADFARENSFMATTYRNSLFTISANISTNMDSGIFNRRSFASHRIRIVDSNGVSTCFRIRQAIRHDGMPTDLETRGWTLQEYVLPARILTFGDFDVSWRCQEIQRCECGEMNCIVNGPHPMYQALPAKALSAPGDEVIIVWWHHTVGHYSRRKLTNEQDKLPALSGLAQLYHTATSHTYLAGLWEETLHEDLCWHHIESSRPMALRIGRRRRQFRSPSWSWASLDAHSGEDRCFWWYERRPARMRWRGTSLINKVCTIFEVNCKPRTNDPFGEVDPDAFIEIGTALIPATIAVKADEETKGCPGGFDQLWKRRLLPWILSIAGYDPDRFVYDCFPDCRLEDDDVKIGDTVYCAPILENLTDCWSEVGCLILKCVEGQQYRRVGFCVLRKKNPFFPQEAQAGTLDVVMMENTGNIEGYAFKCSQKTEFRIVIL